MSAETRRLVGPSSGIMYGLCKVHKDVIDNCQSFQTILSDCNWTRTHNHLAPKQTQNHLAKLTSLAKWLSVRFRTKWLWVQVQLQSLKLQICTYFEWETPWHSGNYRVCIHTETRMWHDKNIQTNYFVCN